MKMKKKKKGRLKIVKVITLLLAAIVVLTTVAFLAFPGYFLGRGLEKWGGAAAAETITSDRVNILLLGFDRNEKRDNLYTSFRPDTIMIASLNYKTNEVALVSIPRDSYVKIADRDVYDKINHSYMYGFNAATGEEKHTKGLESTIRTVEDFLGGIPIHYYVSLDMEGVRQLVDRVGGVYFEVEHPVRSKLGRGRLLLDKGYQLLDGDKFLTFVRDRSVGGDFGRAGRQQEILIEAFKQIKERGKLRDIPTFYRLMQDNIETNMSPALMGQLALFGLKVKAETITAHIFTGKVQLSARNGQNISYVVIAEQARVELIKEAFGTEVPLREQITLPGPIQRPVEKTAPQEAPAEVGPEPAKGISPPAAGDETSPPLEEPAPPPGDGAGEGDPYIETPDDDGAAGGPDGPAAGEGEGEGADEEADPGA